MPYFAVRPVNPELHRAATRIEKAASARQAYNAAFGRGDPHGAYEVKQLESLKVVRSTKQLQAAIAEREGWVTLGKTMEQIIAERRAAELETPPIELTSKAIKAALGRSLYNYLADAYVLIQVPAGERTQPLPPKTEILRAPNGVDINVTVPSPNGPRFFEISVKERF